MKKVFLTVAAVAMVIAMVGGAWAASINQNVTATVLKTCTFSSPGDIAFGSLNPATIPGAATATVNLSVQCSNGTTLSVDTFDGGQGAGVVTTGNCAAFTGQMLDGNGAGTHPLSYSLSCQDLGGGAGKFSGTGFGAGASTLTLTGTISQANVQNAYVGGADASYKDIVKVTYSF